MKKVIAVLLAMLMICSAMTVAFSVFAEEETPDVPEVVVTEGEGEKEEDKAPDWFTNLMNRLMEIFTKLLAKLALKLKFKGIDITDLLPAEPTTDPAEAPAVA